MGSGERWKRSLAHGIISGVDRGETYICSDGSELSHDWDEWMGVVEMEARAEDYGGGLKITREMDREWREYWKERTGPAWTAFLPDDNRSGYAPKKMKRCPTCKGSGVISG